MYSKRFIWDDAFLTHRRSHTPDDLGRLASGVLDMLREHATVRAIRDALFPKRTTRTARDLIVRTAERSEFAEALRVAWRDDAGEAAVAMWKRWCTTRRTSRDRLRLLRRLIHLSEELSQ